MSKSTGRRRTSPRPPVKIIGLLPIWALIQPVRGMAMIDPTPRQKRIRPSSPSPTPTFALAKGTQGCEAGHEETCHKEGQAGCKAGSRGVHEASRERCHVRSSGPLLSVARRSDNARTATPTKWAPQLGQSPGLSMLSQSTLAASA